MVELPQRPGFKVCSNSLSPSIFCGTQLFYCVYWSCAFIRPRGSFLGVVPHFFWPKWPQAKSSNWTKMLIVINLCLLGCNCCDSLRWKMEKEKKAVGWAAVARSVHWGFQGHRRSAHVHRVFHFPDFSCGNAADGFTKGPRKLFHICQTQNPPAESGPPRHFKWPSRAYYACELNPVVESAQGE